MTPYDTKVSAIDMKASQLGFIKYQVSGFAPAPAKEPPSEQKQMKLAEKAIFAKLIDAGTLQNVYGLDPNDYADEINRALDPNDDDEDDSETDEEKPPSAAALAYYNKQSEEEIAKMKFLLIPEHTLDRATKFRHSLCRCGQQSGKFTSFIGSRGDSHQMLFKISEWMRNCKELLKTSKSLGVFELTAITMGIFQVPWWIQDTWHVSKYTRIAVSTALSNLWQQALAPESCKEAHIDEDNKDAFITFLEDINSTWKDFNINIKADSSNDMIEDDDEDAQHSGGMSDMSELFDF